MSGSPRESWAGWGPSPDNIRFQTPERAGLSARDLSRLELKWAFGFFGASAMLVRAPSGRDVLVAGQKSGIVYAFDPANGGKLLWQARVGKGGASGGIQWGMASDGRHVYASVSDLVRQPGGIGGAAPIGLAQLDPMQGGGLAALNIVDGTQVWFAASTPCNPPRPS